MGEKFEILYTDDAIPGHDWAPGNLNQRFTFLGNTGAGLVNFERGNLRRAIRLFRFLVKNSPETLVIYGATVPMLAAFLYGILWRKKRVYMTDSWAFSYSKLSLSRKFIRRFVFRYNHRYIVIGENGKQHLIEQKIAPEKIEIVKIPPVVGLEKEMQLPVEQKTAFEKSEAGQVLPGKSFESENQQQVEQKTAFEKTKTGQVPTIENLESPQPEKKYDLIFAGRFVPRKMPLFFLEVVEKLAALRNIRAVMVGSGAMNEEIVRVIAGKKLPVELPDYAKYEEMNDFYRASKILLFPTEDDVWGMAAQEALSCGLPVVATPFCGIAGDLLRDGVNGFVLPPDSDVWAEKINLLLNEPYLSEFSASAKAVFEGISLRSECDKFIKFVDF